ncbi:MAG: methionyl-tRNA formyltransferase [Acidobacteriota bacterium]
MNVVFCGTPRFAVPTLTTLVNSGFTVSLVVTRPDKPRGRGLEVVFSPVKHAALQFGLPVVQPEKIKNNEQFRSQLSSLAPDAVIVVGYGRIIPQWMIDLPLLGNLNVHASLLPKYRGAAPIQWAIASGESVTGVTTMRIDAGLDTGDVLLQKEIPILADDTAETLAPRLADLGAALMIETLYGLQAGTLTGRSQDHSKATLAPVLKKEDGLIDFQRTAVEIWNRLRGFQPWPGAYTRFRGKQLQIHAAKPLPSLSTSTPGELVAENDSFIVGCGNKSALEVTELQLEGKKRMSARDFLHGYRLTPGERLGGS